MTFEATQGGAFLDELKDQEMAELVNEPTVESPSKEDTMAEKNKSKDSKKGINEENAKAELEPAPKAKAVNKDQQDPSNTEDGEEEEPNEDLQDSDKPTTGRDVNNGRPSRRAKSEATAKIQKTSESESESESEEDDDARDDEEYDANEGVDEEEDDGVDEFEDDGEDDDVRDESETESSEDAVSESSTKKSSDSPSSGTKRPDGVDEAEDDGEEDDDARDETETESSEDAVSESSNNKSSDSPSFGTKRPSRRAKNEAVQKMKLETRDEGISGMEESSDEKYEDQPELEEASDTTDKSEEEENDGDDSSSSSNGKKNDGNDSSSSSGKKKRKNVSIKTEGRVKKEKEDDDYSPVKKKAKGPRVSETVVKSSADQMLVVLIQNYKDGIKEIPMDALASSIKNKKGKPYTNHRSDAIADGMKRLVAQDQAEKVKYGKIGAAKLSQSEIDKIPKEVISKDPVKVLEQRFVQFLDRLAKEKKGGRGEVVVDAAHIVWKKLSDGKAYSRKELVAKTPYKATNSSGFEGIMKVLTQMDFIEGKGKCQFSAKVFPHGRP